MTRDTINAAVHAAYQLVQQGRPDDAADACRRLIAQHPREAWPQALLGHLLRVGGDIDGAIAHLEKARRLDPRIAPPCCDLALIHAARGAYEPAVALATRARELAPNDPNVQFALGQVLLESGRADAGERAFVQAERLAPGFAAARYELGVAAFQARRFDIAAAHFSAVTKAQPQRLNAWVNLGLGLLQLDQHPASYAALTRAAALAPDDATIATHLANVLEAGRSDDADVTQALAHAAALAPQDVTLQLRSAAAASQAHCYADARRALERVLALDPDHLLARWVHFQTPEFEAHASLAARERFLADWRDGIADMAQRLDDADNARRHAPALLDSITNFYISYFGEPLVAEQRANARLVRRIAAAAGLTRHERAPRPIVRSRRRVGVVSAYLHGHSVTKVLGNVLLALPAEDFELIAFYAGTTPDAVTARWRARADAWHDGAANADVWAERIATADLDVLVFPDLGMHPLQHALAALRLAPVQVACWGHPCTTGFDTVDYFLSPDAMEPAGADAHYVERLVRLPRLGTWFDDPRLPAGRYQSADGPVFACAQHAAKLHPGHDVLFGRLLLACPTLRLELYTGAPPGVVEALCQRLRAAGLDVGGRVKVLGKLDAAEFAARLAGVDALLDTLDFSGGITSLESLAQGLPIVSLPGMCMRGRQTAAMLRHLGLDELIARDTDDYIAIATRLATDAGWRESLAERIAANRGKLFGDRGVAAFLADFLRNVQPIVAE